MEGTWSALYPPKPSTTTVALLVQPRQPVLADLNSAPCTIEAPPPKEPLRPLMMVCRPHELACEDCVGGDAAASHSRGSFPWTRH